MSSALCSVHPKHQLRGPFPDRKVSYSQNAPGHGVGHEVLILRTHKELPPPPPQTPLRVHILSVIHSCGKIHVIYQTAKFNFLNLVCYAEESKAASSMSSWHRQYSASPSSTRLEMAKHASDILEEIKILLCLDISSCQQSLQKPVLTPGVCRGQSGSLSNCGCPGWGWFIGVLLF